MSKMWIVAGDKTTHGGAVINGSPFTDINSKPVARISDPVSCPQCGPTTIASGDPTIVIDGQPVARHGDATACGATLISGQQFRVFIDAGGGAGSAAAQSAVDAAASLTGRARERAVAVTADEQLHFLNANGAVLAGVDYRIELEDGEALTGTTDDEGKTTRIVTSKPTRMIRARLSSDNTDCCPAKTAASGGAIEVPLSAVSTHPNQVGSSVQQVTTPSGEARGLTPGEISMAKLVFADAIDCSKVKVHKGEYLWFGMQPDDTAMTPNGEMYFNEARFEKDFSILDEYAQHWFMHEMTHVWQYQLGYPVKTRGAIRIGLPYGYTLENDKRLFDYNMEAQGNILADYFLLKFRSAPELLSEAKYRRSPDAMTLYSSVLQDFIMNPANKGNLP